MEVESKLKRWGNSIGIILPMEALKSNGLEEGEDVIVEVRKKRKIKDLFGSLPNLKASPQKIKDDLRKEWSKW